MIREIFITPFDCPAGALAKLRREGAKRLCCAAGFLFQSRRQVKAPVKSHKAASPQEHLFAPLRLRVMPLSLLFCEVPQHD
jgi:hypothetical protein